MHASSKKRVEHLKLFQELGTLSILDFQHLASYASRETARKTLSRYRDELLIDFVAYDKDKNGTFKLTSLGKKYLQKNENRTWPD